VSGARRRPNILWICTDQQRYDTLGAQGNGHVRTPRLDRLWGSGAAFTHAYCQSPICTPSRASFLTGTYPSTCHNTRNGNDRFVERFPLVTRLLADAGYDCGLIGKLHLASAFGRIEARTDDGYRYWRYSHGPRDDWPVGHDYADWVRQQGSVLGELIEDPAGVPAPLHQTTWCAERTIEFITEPRAADTPWLACVNIYDPHPPFNPPREYRERYDPAAMPGPLFRDSDLAQQERLAAVDFQSRGRPPHDLDIRSPVIPESPGREGSVGTGARAAGRSHLPPHATARDAHTLQAAYYAMIELIDDQVGRMLDALGDSGQADDTLVLFTSDHGEMLGDHGLIQKGCRFYEGAGAGPPDPGVAGHHPRRPGQRRPGGAHRPRPFAAGSRRCRGARVDAGTLPAAAGEWRRRSAAPPRRRAVRVLRRPGRARRHPRHDVPGAALQAGGVPRPRAG